MPLSEQPDSGMPETDKTKILAALKKMEDGKEVDLNDLPALTPEEQVLFDQRDTQGRLKEMLKERGIDENSDEGQG